MVLSSLAIISTSNRVVHAKSRAQVDIEVEAIEVEAMK